MSYHGIAVYYRPGLGRVGFQVNGFGVADWARTRAIAALLFEECVRAMRKGEHHAVPKMS